MGPKSASRPFSLIGLILITSLGPLNSVAGCDAACFRPILPSIEFRCFWVLVRSLVHFMKRKTLRLELFCRRRFLCFLPG